MIKRVNFFGDCVADYDLRECPYCGAGRQAPETAQQQMGNGPKVYSSSFEPTKCPGRKK